MKKDKKKDKRINDNVKSHIQEMLATQSITSVLSLQVERLLKEVKVGYCSEMIKFTNASKICDDDLIELATTETFIVEYEGFKNYGDGCGGLSSTTFWDTHLMEPWRKLHSVLSAAAYVAVNHENLTIRNKELIRVAENIARYFYFKDNKLDEGTNFREENYD